MIGLNVSRVGMNPGSAIGAGQQLCCFRVADHLALGRIVTDLPAELRGKVRKQAACGGNVAPETWQDNGMIW